MNDRASVLEDRATAIETLPAAARASATDVPSQWSADGVACESCGGTCHRPIAHQRGWMLRRCDACGLISVYPQPTRAQLAAIYTQAAGYFAAAEADLSRSSAEPARRLHRRLIAAGVEGRRFLDVGCATGQLAYHMARLGWQVTGTDVNPDAVAVARANGLDVAEGELEEQAFPDASFDVIHMGDVLEHLRHPRRALLAARRLLRPGGLLVVRTPNADCGFARASLRLSRSLGVPWLWSAAPYHLYEFSPDALSRLLEGAGLKITQLECEGRPALLYTLGASGFCDGLKRRLKHGGRCRFDWRLITSVPKLIGVGLVLLPAFVYGVLADRRRRTGHRISVIAKRPSSDCAQERDSTASTEHEATPGPRPTPKAEMPGEHEADILGIRFDLLSCTQALATIESWRRRGKRRYVTFSNPHSVMMSQRDDRLSRAFAQAGMTLPDGTGIIAAANLLGYRNQGRVAGPSFMLACCDWGRQHGYRHYFYGGGDGVAEALAARLAEQYPGLRVVGTCSPPFRKLSPEEDEALVARVNAAKPDIVWVGLGAPKQERWMAAHAAHVKATAMMGVGAAFDFHAGKTSWAPRWVRRLGIEWAYRLACEPRRMWRRNLDSPLFLFRVLQQWMRRVLDLASRRNPPRSTSATSVQPDASEELP